MQGLPRAKLSLLKRADGSVALSQDGYTVIGAVNGPIEPSRRDELAEEAAVDVTIRPASGVSGVRERHTESIVSSALRHIILTHQHPRTVIQVTLQVTSTAGKGAAFSERPLVSQADSSLPILPALLQASVFALLSASIPLSTIFTSTILAINTAAQVVKSPTYKDLRDATSVHVLSFTSHGDLLVAESEGDFDIDTWEKAFDAGKDICCRSRDSQVSEDLDMSGDQGNSIEDILRSAFEEKTSRDQRWKEEIG
ncbi:MAG: Serine/threonine-protein phosphatase 2A activator 2 [Chaenotheca gracillima]|nr:MAG: Serine/threonine-protein phosphatase 2A activator 2 [Chaenotheca gracillima]